MTVGLAKASIVELWKSYRADKVLAEPPEAFGKAAWAFYCELEKARSDLLQWRSKDRWQDVKCWIYEVEGYGHGGPRP